jgi:hypothetical protein
VICDLRLVLGRYAIYGATSHEIGMGGITREACGVRELAPAVSRPWWFNSAGKPAHSTRFPRVGAGTHLWVSDL